MQIKIAFIVVGEPIRVEKTEKPTEEQINSLHKKYIESLELLYKTHNEKYGSKDIELNIKWSQRTNDW